MDVLTFDTPSPVRALHILMPKQVFEGQRGAKLTSSGWEPAAPTRCYPLMRSSPATGICGL